jgi:hypothetical protein
MSNVEALTQRKNCKKSGRLLITNVLDKHTNDIPNTNILGSEVPQSYLVSSF